MEEEQKTTTGLAGVLASISTDTGTLLQYSPPTDIKQFFIFIALAGDSDSIKEPSKQKCCA